MTATSAMEIPGAPIHLIDCCEAQEFHVSRHGSVCFDKVPAVRRTEETESVIGKCRFCEQTIAVEFDRRLSAWSVRSTQPH